MKIQNPGNVGEFLYGNVWEFLYGNVWEIFHLVTQIQNIQNNVEML